MFILNVIFTKATREFLWATASSQSLREGGGQSSGDSTGRDTAPLSGFQNMHHVLVFLHSHPLIVPHLDKGELFTLLFYIC